MARSCCIDYVTRLISRHVTEQQVMIVLLVCWSVDLLVASTIINQSTVN